MGGIIKAGRRPAKHSGTLRRPAPAGQHRSRRRNPAVADRAGAPTDDPGPGRTQPHTLDATAITCDARPHAGAWLGGVIAAANRERHHRPAAEM